MDKEKELTLAEIERYYSHRWVLVEETAWDKQGVPLRAIVRAHSNERRDLSAHLQALHKQMPVKTFVFYTGEVVPKDVTVVL